MAKRALKQSWLDAWCELQSKSGSPALHIKWAGIGAVAAALERKVWLKTVKGVLYPNLYIFLVGEPGVGKTVQTSAVYRLMQPLLKSPQGRNHHHVVEGSVNYATIIDELFEAKRTIIDPSKPGPADTFNALTAIIGELSILIPIYDATMLGKLTWLYDCEPYTERRRGKGINIRIERPILNILAATTPAQLNGLLPDAAWDEGFMSRTIIAYSGEVVPFDLWDKVEDDKKLRKQIEDDFERIAKMHGKFVFEKDAADAINEWQKAGGHPIPAHPRLRHYCTRRLAHLLKLCMIVSAAENDDLIITIEQYQKALDILIEVEAGMEDVFRAMASGGDLQIIRETWHFVHNRYFVRTNKKPVPEPLIMQFIAQHTSAYNAPKILEVMIRSGLLQKINEPKIGATYKPLEMKKL